MAVLLAVPFGRVSASGAEVSPQPDVAQRLLGAGREAAHRGGYGEADVALRAALAACRADGDEGCMWTALASLTAVAQARGRLDEAGAFAQEAATVAHRMRDRPAQGESYHLLALVLAEGGDADAARDAARRALAVGQELERDDLRAMAMTVLGRLALAAGNTDEACVAFEEALARARQVGLVPLTMRARVGLGRCQLAQGDLPEAEAAFEEAFAEAVGLGDKLSVARLMQAMGRLAVARQESKRAEELLVEAVRKYRVLGASAYAERAATELENLRVEADLPTAADLAARSAEARRRGVERFEAGDVEAAVRELKEAVRLAPYDPEAHRALARAYQALGLEALAEQENRYASDLTANTSPFDHNSRYPRYRDYFVALRRQIDRTYVVPAEVARGELVGTVRVTFTLERTGRLAEASVETSAGSAILDEAALTTLRLAEPFEPFPEGVSQEQVTITARFVYERDLADGGGTPSSKP
ncbi:MAG: TonB family protein [Nitrospinota bacterium]